MIRKATTALFALLTILAFGPSATGQTALGTLRGAVHDEQGGVLPGAIITASVETNTIQSALTSVEGQHYRRTCRAAEWSSSRGLAMQKNALICGSARS